MDRETLYRLYIIEKKTQEEIGDIYSVHRKTIGRKLREFGISKTRKQITEEINDRNFEKYGFRTPAERKEISQKIKLTNQQRYGNNSSLHGVNQSKTEQYIKESIGVVNPSLSKLSEESRNILTNKENFESYLLKEQNTSSKVISSKLNISTITFNRYIKKYDLEHLVDRQMSRGASLIEDFLVRQGLDFQKEKSFDDCLGDKGKLFFDFFLKGKNILIEFDGRQHFESIEYWGGDEGLEQRQRYDQIKNNYCKEKNIKLIRFNHLQSEEEIISQLVSLV